MSNFIALLCVFCATAMFTTGQTTDDLLEKCSSARAKPLSNKVLTFSIGWTMPSTSYNRTKFLGPDKFLVNLLNNTNVRRAIVSSWCVLEPLESDGQNSGRVILQFSKYQLALDSLQLEGGEGALKLRVLLDMKLLASTRNQRLNFTVTAGIRLTDKRDKVVARMLFTRRISQRLKLVRRKPLLQALPN
ncbi:unnamed protein product [Dicrocoelium dendriticum]|nr:unnamed protein product [Dicrocoelium dendriticum]